MKKIITQLLLLFACFSANAQATSLNETFDTVCATAGSNYPTGWTEYHFPATNTLMAWNCTPTYGVGFTGAQEVNGYYSATNHLDTAWLVTDTVNLSSYPGNIYLWFDTKFKFAGDMIAIMVSHNYGGGNPDSSAYVWTDLTGSISPAFGMADSLAYVTHSANLTPYKSLPLRIGFRYTSSTTACKRWDLDNVKTSTLMPTVAAGVSNGHIPLQVLYPATGDKIQLQFTSPGAGAYDVALYDMVGRKAGEKKFQLDEGEQILTISGLGLQAPEVYLIRLTGPSYSGTAKAFVQ